MPAQRFGFLKKEKKNCLKNINFINSSQVCENIREKDTKKKKISNFVDNDTFTLNYFL